MIHLIVSPRAWSDSGAMNTVAAAINGPKELHYIADIVDLEVPGTGHAPNRSRVKSAADGAMSKAKHVVMLRWDGKSLTGIDGPVTEAIRQRINVMQTAVTSWRKRNQKIGETMVKNSEATMNEQTTCTKCKDAEATPYRIANDERLCPSCLADEYERAGVVTSAYIHWLRSRLPKTAKQEEPCPICGDTRLISDGKGTVRCPKCKMQGYFGPELGTQEIVGDGSVPCRNHFPPPPGPLQILRCLKLPAEAALASEPKLHEAGTPTGNVTVTWHTSYHTLHELLDVIEKAGDDTTEEDRFGDDCGGYNP